MASLELQKAVQGYENYIKTNGITQDVVDAYFMACQAAFIEKEELSFCFKITSRTKSIIDSYIKKHK